MLESTFLYKIYKLKRKGIPLSFFKLMQKLRRNEGVMMTFSDIEELYFDIDKKSDFLSTLSRANKFGVNISVADAKRIFSIRNSPDTSFQQLIELLTEAKKADIKLTVDELIKIYSEGRDINQIIRRVVRLKKEGYKANPNDIKSVFYGNGQATKLLENFIKSKKINPEITSSQIKSVFVNGSQPEKFYNVIKLLKKENISVPFHILLNLMKEDTNIIKGVKILSKAKKSTLGELSLYKHFDEDTNNKLSNIYVIEGKEKFKKSLSNELIKRGIMIDPAEMYDELVKSENNGFKVNLETIKDYLSFHFRPGITEITDSYLKARNNNLYVTYKQLAQLAEKEIDVKQFVDAQIKSGSDE